MEKAAKIFKGIVRFGVFMVALLYFSAFMLNDCSGTSLAKVESKDGILIFYKSIPCSKYEDLGTVKVGLTLTNNASEKIDALIRKAKKEYPSGSAIIISDPEFGSAGVIKFLPDE